MKIWQWGGLKMKILQWGGLKDEIVAVRLFKRWNCGSPWFKSWMLRVHIVCPYIQNDLQHLSKHNGKCWVDSPVDYKMLKNVTKCYKMSQNIAYFTVSADVWECGATHKLTKQCWNIEKFWFLTKLHNGEICFFFPQQPTHCQMLLMSEKVM